MVRIMARLPVQRRLLSLNTLGMLLNRARKFQKRWINFLRIGDDDFLMRDAPQLVSGSGREALALPPIRQRRQQEWACRRRQDSLAALAPSAVRAAIWRPARDIGLKENPTSV